MDIIKLFPDGFPATIETFLFLQDAYTKPLKALSLMAGNNTILDGITNLGGNLSEGWFVQNGEPIYFKACPVGATVYIVEKTIQVPYNIDGNFDGDLDLKDAYVSRYGTTVIGEGEVEKSNFTFSLLKRIPSFTNLLPIGSAILWFDPANIPSGYRLMDGSGGDIVTPYGTAVAIDLRNQFIKMAGSDGGVGAGGGSKTTTLISANLPQHTHTTPAHSHTYKDSYYVENLSTGAIGGTDAVSPTRGSSSTDDDNRYIFWRTGTTAVSPAGDTGNGGSSLQGLAFNNEPLHYRAIWIQYVGL